MACALVVIMNLATALKGHSSNGLALFLNFFKIPNGQGAIPSVRLQGKIGTEEFKFVITGDGKADIHTTPVRDEETASGHEKEFRIFHKAQELKIGNALRSRHSDLVWRQLQDTEIKQIIDVQAGFDAELLCSPEGNRTVAKYALNLLIRAPRGRQNSQCQSEFLEGDSDRLPILWT